MVSLLQHLGKIRAKGLVCGGTPAPWPQQTAGTMCSSLCSSFSCIVTGCRLANIQTCCMCSIVSIRFSLVAFGSADGAAKLLFFSPNSTGRRCTTHGWYWLGAAFDIRTIHCGFVRANRAHSFPAESLFQMTHCDMEGFWCLSYLLVKSCVCSVEANVALTHVTYTCDTKMQNKCIALWVCFIFLKLHTFKHCTTRLMRSTQHKFSVKQLQFLWSYRDVQLNLICCGYMNLL